METEYKRIAVYNLPKDIKESIVKERFSRYGNITDVFFSGCATIIEFDADENAIEATLGENGRALHGCEMSVQIMKETDKKNSIVKKEPGTEYASFVDPLKQNPRIDDLGDAENAWSDQWKQTMSSLDEKEDREEYGGRRKSGREESPMRERTPVRTGGNDVEIVVMDFRERRYAESIEDKLLRRHIQVDLLFPELKASIFEILRNIADRGTLFALQVDAFSVRHQTVTLYKLQDDGNKYEDVSPNQAVEIILTDMASASRKFQFPKSKVFHPKHITSLLYRSIQNQYLKDSEYSTLIKYLSEQRMKQSPRETRSSRSSFEGNMLDRDLEHDLSAEEKDERILDLLDSLRDGEPHHNRPSAMETLKMIVKH